MWITTKLVRVANLSAQGRVVSLLEGWYQLAGEYTSAFARSVKTHVEALANEGRRSARYDPAEDAHEQAVERQVQRFL